MTKDRDVSPPPEIPETAAAASRKPQNNIVQGTSAASVRAIGVQLISFYFRAPVKAFFRMRVDYMQMARAINPRIQANEKWSFRQTTPLLLAHAVKHHGWGFIPNQVLPPLLANASIGAVLYTTYLTTLSALHPPSSQHSKRVYPPPPPSSTFTAGAAAGTIQSILAAPLDALIAPDAPSSSWVHSLRQLRALSVRGIFAGYGLSLAKEALGYGLFFAVFEAVKQQACFGFLAWRCRGEFIRPHYAVEPAFLLLAGVAASVAQQAVQHPLARVQEAYISAGTYRRTIRECRVRAADAGGWWMWAYRGFGRNALRQVPGTSAGLIVFEVVRRRYAGETEGMVIEYGGSRILL